MLDGLKMEETLQSALEPLPASFPSLLGGAGQARSVCEGCRGVIVERFLLRLNEGFWHERCVRCASCQERLKSTCFYREKKLYCRLHYENCNFISYNKDPLWSVAGTTGGNRCKTEKKN